MIKSFTFIRMTRRTQKSSRQRKRHTTCRRGGVRGPHIEGAKKIQQFCKIMMNGVTQCFQKKSTNTNNENNENNEYENNNGSEYRRRKEPTPKKNK